MDYDSKEMRQIPAARRNRKRAFAIYRTDGMRVAWECGICKQSFDNPAAAEMHEYHR